MADQKPNPPSPMAGFGLQKTPFLERGQDHQPEKFALPVAIEDNIGLFRIVFSDPDNDEKTLFLVLCIF